jgi:hypothetical protein
MQYYTSPISDYTFNMKSEVLEYLFSQADERILESKESGAGNSFQVHSYHLWYHQVFVIDMLIYIFMYVCVLERT